MYKFVLNCLFSLYRTFLVHLMMQQWRRL